MTDITANRHGGNAESAAANRSVEGAKAKMRAAVLHEYRVAGPDGLTSDEVQAKLAGTHQGISPRVTELKAEGLIFDTKRRRKTRSGRTAAVLVYCAFAEPEPPPKVVVKAGDVIQTNVGPGVVIPSGSPHVSGEFYPLFDEEVDGMNKK